MFKNRSVKKLKEMCNLLKLSTLAIQPWTSGYIGFVLNKILFVYHLHCLKYEPRWEKADLTGSRRSGFYTGNMRRLVPVLGKAFGF